ncbi:MAG: nucleotide exchange factor GrpE [Bdellovibrionales bacterium]|nr:nucleotide exchange factor GrpE [Bdellovibrionales bacterium]
MKRRRFKKRIKVENADSTDQLEVADAEDAMDDDGLDELDQDQELEDQDEEMFADVVDSEGESDFSNEQQSAALDKLAAELEVIREEAKRYQDEARENYDKFLRAVAEMENVKKRSKKERSDLLRYAGEGMARELLEVLDSLELALKQRVTEGEPNDFSRGIEMIRDQFVSTFERFGIKGESAVGKQFDPELHEAMVSVPTGEHPAGSVIEEYKKLFRFRDKLLRPAQVVVASAPEGAQAASPTEAESSSEESGESGEAEVG